MAGPSLSRAVRRPNVRPPTPSEAGVEPGVMGRARATLTPFARVPLGLSLDLGLTVATGRTTTTVVPGLAVRLGG